MKTSASQIETTGSLVGGTKERKGCALSDLEIGVARYSRTGRSPAPQSGFTPCAGMTDRPENQRLTRQAVPVARGEICLCRPSRPQFGFHRGNRKTGDSCLPRAVEEFSNTNCRITVITASSRVLTEGILRRLPFRDRSLRKDRRCANIGSKLRLAKVRIATGRNSGYEPAYSGT